MLPAAVNFKTVIVFLLLLKQLFHIAALVLSTTVLNSRCTFAFHFLHVLLTGIHAESIFNLNVA